MVRREDVAHAAEHAVRQVPGVSGLSPGSGFVEASTLYPGGKVVGVRLTDTDAEVHIVADRTPLPELVRDVQTAMVAVLAAAGQHQPVTVYVDDISTGAADRRRRNDSR